MSDTIPLANESTAAVAVIVRTKDRPLLLARALASVLSQRFPDWILCLVNDGGDREGVERIVEPLRPLFGSRLRVVHHDASLGMEAASNRALRETASTYAVVHDDDDSWHPDFLDRTVAFLEREENHAYCGVIAWSERVEERIEGGEIHVLERRPYNNWYYGIGIDRMLAGNIVPPISFLFRRSIVDRVGPFDETLRVLGDWDFHVRCLLQQDIAVIPETLAYYHHRKEESSQDVYGNSIYAAEATHSRTDSRLRNALLRRHFEAHPTDLATLAAMSRNFVGLTERLNEVEIFLDERVSGRVIERLNQVEAYLAAREDAVIERLNQVEAHLAARDSGVIERLNQVEAFLAHRLAATEAAALRSRPVYRALRSAWRALTAQRSKG